MKKLLTTLLLILGATLGAAAAVPAQVQRAVARAKAAATLNVECTINGSPASATISGNCFSFNLGQAQVYFDGTTQWSYSPADKEVTIFNPTAAELAESNPLQILLRLDSDFTGAAVAGKANTVRLTPVDPKNQITEATVVFDPATGWPTEMTIIAGGRRALLKNFRFNPSKTKKPAEAFKFKTPKGTTINDLR